MSLHIVVSICLCLFDHSWLLLCMSLLYFTPPLLVVSVTASSGLIPLLSCAIVSDNFCRCLHSLKARSLRVLANWPISLGSISTTISWAVRCTGCLLCFPRYSREFCLLHFVYCNTCGTMLCFTSVPFFKFELIYFFLVLKFYIVCLRFLCDDTCITMFCV